MPTRSLQWYGALPNPTQKSFIRRCILNFTSEATDPMRVFGMFQSDPTVRDGTIPFTYNNRLFLTVFREGFFVVFEDSHLNIRALIEELWDCNPVKYVDLPFAEYFDHYMENA